MERIAAPSKRGRTSARKQLTFEVFAMPNIPSVLNKGWALT
jgi:hypothetical protein